MAIPAAYTLSPKKENSSFPILFTLSLPTKASKSFKKLNFCQIVSNSADTLQTFENACPNRLLYQQH